MESIIVLLALIISGLVATNIYYFNKSTLRREEIKTVRTDANNARKMAVEAATRMAEMAGLDSYEIAEIMVEQSTMHHATSDKWKVELPYGKWTDFNDGPKESRAQIRGFWHNCPGRIIGVKMGIGSEYEFHYHEWVETLVGLTGLVIVQIEGKDGKITHHNLGPDDVITIPAGIKHAVLKAKVHSEFVCIWGQPK